MHYLFLSMGCCRNPSLSPETRACEFSAGLDHKHVALASVTDDGYDIRKYSSGIWKLFVAFCPASIYMILADSGRVTPAPSARLVLNLTVNLHE